MIKTLFKILLIVLLLILQLTIFNKFSIFSATPNLIMIVSISLILKQKYDLGIIIAGFGGLVLDVVSPLHFGIYTIANLTIALMIYYFILKVSESPNRWVIFLIFVLSAFIMDGILFLFTKTIPNWNILISTFINGLYGIIIYVLIETILPQKEEINVV